MARQQMRWLFLSCKRALMRPMFLLLLILLPIGAWGIRQMEDTDDGKIAIALFADGDSWNEQVAGRLIENSSSFTFYLCGTKKELVEDVAAGRAECGFSFPAGMQTLLKTRDYKRAVRVTVSPSTTVADLASEVVFAGMFEVFGRELLESYVEEGEAFSEAREAGGPVWNDLELLYKKYRSDGSTFSFVYETVDSGVMAESEMKSVFPVRGIGAVFVLVMGLAAAVMAAEDEKRGFYAAVTVGQRRGFQMYSIGSMVALSCAAVLAALAAAGDLHNGMEEIFALILYGTATVVMSSCLLWIFRDSMILSGMIPVLIVGSLVSCPVFVDLSTFLPVLKMIRQCFLPWYYMSHGIQVAQLFGK